MAGVSPSKTFTPKQGQYLAFIHLYTRLHRRPPAETDMQEYFRVSPPSIHQMVLSLEGAGLIKRLPRTPRSIEVPQRAATAGNNAATKPQFQAR
jgi:DNA-binding MarR family transcriptional regulator